MRCLLPSRQIIRSVTGCKYIQNKGGSDTVLSVTCAFSGIIISIPKTAPAGSKIAAADIAAFAVCYVAAVISNNAADMLLLYN